MAKLYLGNILDLKIYHEKRLNKKNKGKKRKP